MNRTLSAKVCIRYMMFLASNSLHNLGGQKWSCPCYHARHLQQIHRNKIFCRIYGLGVMLMEFQEKNAFDIYWPLHKIWLVFFCCTFEHAWGCKMFCLKLHKPRIYSVSRSTVLLDNYFNFPENYCRNQRSNKIFTHKSISMQRAMHSSLLHSNVVCVGNKTGKSL